MSVESENEYELNNLEDETILNKYKEASEIVQKIVKELIQMCKAGSTILSLCIYGDNRITEETGKIYKKDKEMKKGIAFPTCIMRNNMVCNFSPLEEQAEEVLCDGDLVKIDLGAHIDGYAAVIGHTFVVGSSKENKVTDKKANVILAANVCMEAALRLIKPGRNNKDMSEPLNNIAADYGCKVLENCVVNGFEKGIYENSKTFSINPSEDMKKVAEQIEFEVNQVWTIDIIVSTGDGKVKERDAKTTVYKRNMGADPYILKLKASRQFFSDICNRNSDYPFTMRSFDDQGKAKMAVVECAKHELVDALPVVYEKDGELIAQFKCTVLLMPNGPMRLTGVSIDTNVYQSNCKVQNTAAKVLLAETLKNKKKPPTSTKAAGEA